MGLVSINLPLTVRGRANAKTSFEQLLNVEDYGDRLEEEMQGQLWKYQLNHEREGMKRKHKICPALILFCTRGECERNSVRLSRFSYYNL